MRMPALDDFAQVADPARLGQVVLGDLSSHDNPAALVHG